MGAEFEERKKVMMAAGEWSEIKKLLRFAFGNTHEDVVNPKAAKSDPSKRNVHRWCMFMSLNDNIDMTSKYIKSVTYYLHPTFRPNTIKIEEAPFLLSIVGWGYFDVEMKVEF